MTRRRGRRGRRKLFRRFIEAVKQRIARKKSRKTRYMNLTWIPATTCEVERLFSVCKHIYSEFRKAMTPETMEIFLYLRVNRQYWNILADAGYCLIERRMPSACVMLVHLFTNCIPKHFETPAETSLLLK
jgi:hypothetical protein